MCFRKSDLPSKHKQRSGILIHCALLIIFVLLACQRKDSQTAEFYPIQPATNHAEQTSTPMPQIILLPQPRLTGTQTLEEVLAKRRSVRDFSDRQLTREELGQLLWSAQGITHSAGYRTAPSAGALYPLEVFVITGMGTYHYDPEGHRLSLHKEGDLRPSVYEAGMKQSPLLRAPAVFLIAAVFERTEAKYGSKRGPRYVHLEAGHAAQNLLLQAVALDLGAVPIGAFLDDKVKEVLSLPIDHQPLYLIPVGHPAPGPD